MVSKVSKRQKGRVGKRFVGKCLPRLEHFDYHGNLVGSVIPRGRTDKDHLISQIRFLTYRFHSANIPSLPLPCLSYSPRREGKATDRLTGMLTGKFEPQRYFATLPKRVWFVSESLGKFEKVWESLGKKEAALNRRETIGATGSAGMLCAARIG